MIDDRELAVKKVELLYSSENIGRSELILEIYRLLTNGLVTFKICCEKLQNIDPVQRTERFLDVVYGLYLYLHPNTVTTTRCLKSEGEYGVRASQLIENRFTNRFSDFYLENSPTLIRYVSHFLKPVFETDQTEGENEVEKPIEPSFDLRTVRWIIETEKLRLDQNLEYYANPISIFESPVVTIFDVLEKHKIESHTDAFNFIQRLKSVMLEIHQLTQFMEKQRSLKSVEIPKIVAKQCYDMIQGFLKVEPHDHIFMKNFKSDTESLQMSEEIYKIALEFVNDSVYRALYHLGDWINEFFLEEDEVPSDRNDENDNNEEECILSDYSVCCDRNRGREYYSYCLKHHTTTDLSPEEIHNLGLSEVERISEEILRTVISHLEQSESNQEVVKVETFEQAIEYIRKLSADSNSVYPDTKDGEAEIVKDILEIDTEIKTYLPDLFVEETLPKSVCQYRFTPEHQKESAPAGYYTEPSFDGKKQGVFYMNLRSELLRFGLPTLVAHEAIPGHHFQLSSVAESNLHPIRKIEFYNGFNAYIEGWALYTEMLCKDKGLYDTPLKLVGHLMDEMLRAARLVIDTGIHHYGWDREKALAYMCEVCPFPLKSNEIEIDRYIGWPGQACSYKVGQLKIIEARDRALSSGGSLQEFNTRLIQNGAVPIDMI